MRAATGANLDEFDAYEGTAISLYPDLVFPISVLFLGVLSDAAVSVGTKIQSLRIGSKAPNRLERVDREPEHAMR
jgi:hypothetical protein